MDKTDDIQGLAFLDYMQNPKPFNMKLHTSYSSPDKMPVELFFRNFDGLSSLEKKAVSLCKGYTLDIGAGAGSLSLILQERFGLEVAALEISPISAKIIGERGVREVHNLDIFDFEPQRSFDTLLLMMNGIGLAGQLSRLPALFNKLKSLLAPGGQILCDSSDISYLYTQAYQNSRIYSGEISFQYEYKGKKGPWFDWLYTDKKTMANIAAKQGLQTEVLFDDGNCQYLARIWARS